MDPQNQLESNEKILKIQPRITVTKPDLSQASSKEFLEF